MNVRMQENKDTGQKKSLEEHYTKGNVQFKEKLQKMDTKVKLDNEKAS